MRDGHGSRKAFYNDRGRIERSRGGRQSRSGGWRRAGARAGRGDREQHGRLCAAGGALSSPTCCLPPSVAKTAAFFGRKQINKKTEREKKEKSRVDRSSCTPFPLPSRGCEETNALHQHRLGGRRSAAPRSSTQPVPPPLPLIPPSRRCRRFASCLCHRSWSLPVLQPRARRWVLFPRRQRFAKSPRGAEPTFQ